jgi:hypothetical protein
MEEWPDEEEDTPAKVAFRNNDDLGHRCQSIY